VRILLPVACLVFSGTVLAASPPAPSHAQEQALQGQALVNTALANELRAAQDLSHPMRYLMRKTSPRLTTTRRIYETRDGGVSRLIATGGKPLTAVDDQKEQTRLAQLAQDPARQRHRRQNEDADRARAVRVLRMLPNAFIYQDAGPVQSGPDLLQKFTFRPNPSFNPPDLETQVLTQMAGEILIDAAQQRVVRLEGHLQQDVDFGWGILGRLYKGGWIRLDQADVGGGQWRVVRFQMVMSARIVWRTRSFDTIEEQSEYAPLPASMTYQDAITLLQAEQRAAK
jgi:hypothetical protein